MHASTGTSLRPSPTPAPQHAAPSRRTVPDRAFGGLAVVLMLVALWFSATPGGFDFWSGDTVATLEGGGSIIRKLQWFPLLLGALFLIWIRLPLARLLSWYVNPAIWPLCALATLSTAWSLEPGLTSKRVVLLWATFLIPFAFSITAWRPRRMDDCVRWVMLLMMLMSVLVEVAGPHIGLPASEYWHGITLNKNVLGPLAVTAALFWVHGWMEKRVNFVLAMIATALSVACIIGAKSGTALVLFVLVTPAVMFFSKPWLELRVGAMIGLILGPLLLVGTVLGVYMLFAGIPTLQDILTPATGVIGKDPTLSSRDVIWSFSMDHILQRPWLGYGFGAFWEQTNPDVYHLSNVTMLMIVTEAHNGFLNVALELGVGGLLLALLFIFLEVRQVAQVAHFDRSMAALQGGLLAVFVFNNVTEATLMQATFVPFLTWALCSITLSRRRLHEHLRRMSERRA